MPLRVDEQIQHVSGHEANLVFAHHAHNRAFPLPPNPETIQGKSWSAYVHGERRSAGLQLDVGDPGNVLRRGAKLLRIHRVQVAPAQAHRKVVHVHNQSHWQYEPRRVLSRN